MTALIAKCGCRRFTNAAVLYAAHTPMVTSKTPWTAAFSGSQRPDDSSSRSNTLLCSTARASHASAVQMLILAKLGHAPAHVFHFCHQRTRRARTGTPSGACSAHGADLQHPLRDGQRWGEPLAAAQGLPHRRRQAAEHGSRGPAGSAGLSDR